MMYFGRARGREGAVMMNSRVLDSMVDDSAGDIPADKPREVFPESWMFDLHLIELVARLSEVLMGCISYVIHYYSLII